MRCALEETRKANDYDTNAVVSEKDLRETYLYAFRKLVNAGVESVLCACNSVGGEPVASN